MFPKLIDSLKFVQYIVDINRGYTSAKESEQNRQIYFTITWFKAVTSLHQNYVYIEQIRRDSPVDERP